MAVPEQTPYIEHTGNGVTTSFSLGFQCESKDHLIVLVDEIEPPIATWSLSGGNVVFTIAPAAGKKITLQRNTPFGRTTNYQSFNNSFRPQTVNIDFDRLWLKLQELGVANWLLKQYVDKKDDELKAFLLEEIRKQGVALDQLDEYYNYLMQRLAQIAVDKGWDASFVVDGNENQHQINNSLIRTVKTTNDLLLIQNPKNKQIVHVESVQKTFVYDANLTTPENGVTVIGKWEMQTQEAYYASWFCADSSPSAPKQDEFMIGYVYATSKKRPFVVDIPIYVNSTRKQSGFYNQVHYAAVAQSNSVLWFMPEGKLIQIGVNEAAYSILSLYGADNFFIKNPKLEGDKYTKTGDAGESGFGLAITGCSNGVIEYPEVSECRGDAIYLGQEFYNNNASNLIPKNIKVIKPTLLDSYRNGLTLSAGEDIYFDAPFIDVVEGTAPQACIDIEPEEGLATRSYLKNVIVHNATLLRGKSSGVLQWIGNSRDVDVKFTGTTTISGCYAVLGCNGSAEDWSTVTCNGSITFEKIVFDHRITNNTAGYFDVSVPTRGKGIGVIIDTLEIHTQTPSAGYQIPFLFNGRYTHSGNFKINQMSITDHANTTVINMVRTSAGSTNLEHIKIPIPDIRKIDHYDAVGTYTCGDYVDVGGYEQRAVAIVNADALLANTQLFTPANDGTGATYARVASLPNIGRRLKYKLDNNAVTIGYGLQVSTPFLELSRIECIDKGGYVTIDNTQAQTQISRIFRKWGLDGVYINQ